MKTQVKYWDKYLKHIEKENETYKKMWLKRIEEVNKEHEEAIKRYEKTRRKNKRLNRMEEKKHQEWMDLPWYKKLFIEEPVISYRYEPYYPSVGLMFPMPWREPTYEDFLTWLSKGNI